MSAKSKNSQIACFLEMKFLDKVTSQNVVGLSLFVTENFLKNSRSTSERLTITDQSVKCELDHVTSSDLMGNVMSSISRHSPFFKSF